MKRFKKIISLVLFLCIIATLVPPIQFTQAAEVKLRYELDTDGIDPGATYLIVNTSTVGTGNALRFYYQSSWNRSFQNQSLTIQTEDGIKYIEPGFTNEENCQFQFSAAGTGKITHGDYSVNLSDENFVNGNPEDTLTFENLGNGQYRIYYTTSIFRTKYYLRYNNGWEKYNSNSSSVYLYKLTEYVVGYDVIYNTNGATSGSVPENALQLSKGEKYVLKAPTNLRKDVGDDTWLFLCWNTAPDGTGTEYAPGDTITVNGDVTLYADWYQQTKYSLSMITYLDGTATDVDKIAGFEKSFFAKMEGGDGTYIPLHKTADGTYSTKVADNGTYVIYTQLEDGTYEAVHGHKVVIYNLDGNTECMHYSVSYDAAGGIWAEGEEPALQKYHEGETVIASEKVPTREGYRFLGWADQDGKLHTPGHPVTEYADRKMTLTALWENTVSVTVNVVLDHKAEAGGWDNTESAHDVIFNLFREENGANLPVAEKSLTQGYTYDSVNKTTTYQVVFENMPKGEYHASSVKSNYDTVVEHITDADGNEIINIRLKYKAQNYDLKFDVVVDADNEGEKALMPQSVNVKITYWGDEDDGNLGWYVITQQAGHSAPLTVHIDENGRGSGFFPVWRYRADSQESMEYRVEVTSFVLPDGTIVPAVGDAVTYTLDGSGLYRATVSVEGGRIPIYPDADSGATIPGAYFDGQNQKGVPTVRVEINPYTVKFDAGAGTVNGERSIILTNQYRYPALHDYVAVPNATDKVFLCWTDLEGNPVPNLENQLLNGDVTYYARYNENFVLNGTVAVDAVYEMDGHTVEIPGPDRVKKVAVILQKKVGDIYNDVDSIVVELNYDEESATAYNVGLGRFEFKNIPNNGSEYRLHAQALNYYSAYDNNQDGTFSVEETAVLVDTINAEAKVNVHLDFAPDMYEQGVLLDASQIHADLRPTDALVQIIARDLGDTQPYKIISQHQAPPYGIEIGIDSATATGMGFEEVWNWHTNGTPYEYQAHVSTLYGNVPGAYEAGGTAYSDNSPFTIDYGPANHYLRQNLYGGVMLEATLIPKEYPVFLDLNLDDDPNTPVLGLEDYMVDDGTGNDRYAFIHTWSYAEHFTAYPYREGYVFKGWTSPNTNEVYVKDGVIHVGNTLNHEITLVANWEKLTGTDYTIRYLELNTDEVLQGATVITGAAQGDVVVAAEKAEPIEGFVYAGAMVNGYYLDKNDQPIMTVSDDPVKNLMVIYYLPDGSDGYTEQVESNLEINKVAKLEKDGTYTITMDTYTKDNPITTLIQQNTPLDIVLVLDQSGSLAENEYKFLNALQEALDSFVESVADHGRRNEVDHRIAIVGYAGDEDDAHSSVKLPTGGKESDTWINTGVFDSNGEFHLYNVKGFNYTELTDTSKMTADGIYYTKVTVDGKDKFLLLTHHNEYRHLITAEQARVANLQGEQVYGYVYDQQNQGSFVELTRNSSGLWLYGNKQLYSKDEFFTYHTDVWTHRDGTNPREIHAYGVGAAYTPTDGHEGVYTREETTGDSYQQSIYQDALVPVSVGAAGSGGTNPGLLKATQSLGADGATRASYGMEMANKILEANTDAAADDRVRLVVMFTDGEPGYMGFDSSSGQDYYNQAVTEANNAIAQAYIAKNTHKAYVYTIGLYASSDVGSSSEAVNFMNGVSSNYPNAQSMNDVNAVKYVQAENGVRLENNGKFYVLDNGTYYQVKYGSVNWRYRWYYTRNGTNYSITTTTNPTVSNGKVGGYTIYQQQNIYENAGYYATADSSEHLKSYFEDVLRDITTKITTEIILHKDTILRDIMGQGLVLTPGTVVTAYKEMGVLQDNGEIAWSGKLEYVASAEIPQKMSAQVNSKETTTVEYTLDDGTNVVKENVPYIQIYNLNSANPTNPDKADYHPHTVDITGYDFENWYISERHPEGYKMVVTVTRIEARDDVQWSRSTTTNNGQSGLWLPANEKGERQLLLPFDQPTTIFVERAYVLDYGKEFTLSGWYFDDEMDANGQITKNATPVHVDCNIADGMNYFDPSVPNSVSGEAKYGNVRIEDETVKYTPGTMNWGGYDQFYVFGQTWRKTVLAQNANNNGVEQEGLANLWNKVTVIPANNIYYEDSFVTNPETGIEGFTFNGAWSVVGTDKDNTEQPEHMESDPYGDVHGWTDSLAGDTNYTDGSAHLAFPDGFDLEQGANVEFTFTGTGVEVYTRTNSKSGLVIALLNRKVKDANGVETSVYHQSLMMDNLAMSGDYYHVPTVTFKKLPYGTYTLQLFAVETTAAGTEKRSQYYIDGVRILNPLGNTTNYQNDTVKQAYGLETNAVFTEVRDILLQYKDFNAELDDDQEGKMGAVFIDWIQEGQGSGNDKEETGVPSYEIGTYESYGPKNEVYLSAGQAIVLKVAEGNNYYVGLKSLKGDLVTVNISGIDRADPTTIVLNHTTDMYYQVNPVNGYIVIQNANTNDALLSITNLRTTNLKAVVADGGILPVAQQEAVMLMSDFSAYLLEKQKEEPIPQPDDPEEETIPSAADRAEANEQMASTLFTSVRQWLETE